MKLSPISADKPRTVFREFNVSFGVQSFRKMVQMTMCFYKKVENSIFLNMKFNAMESKETLQYSRLNNEAFE